MSIQVTREEHPDLVSFLLTFPDGTRQRVQTRPRDDDPDGKRFVARAVASIEAKTAARHAERNRAFF